jgi:hypothetical protein
VSTLGDITPAEREDAVRRIRAMLRWSNTSVAMSRALQVAIAALQGTHPEADLPRWPTSGDANDAREHLIAAMAQCAINAPRANQLRAGAMTTSIEDCAIRAIASCCSTEPEAALPMETAPRDGTMIRLLVEFTDHATEDCAGPAWTIGACNDDEVMADERAGWQFAGWCWTHDHFTEGEGRPIGWLPMLTRYATAETETAERLVKRWRNEANAGYVTGNESVDCATTNRQSVFFQCADELEAALRVADQVTHG